jgi:iron(III) transport system permease protein
VSPPGRGSGERRTTRREGAAMSRPLRLDFWSGVLVAAFVVMAILMVWPLYRILSASVIDNRSGAWTLANFAQILGHPAYRGALFNSLIVGTGGMIGAMLLGIPLAALITRFVIVGRDALATLAVLALVSPPFIGAYAWIMMLGANGWMREMLADVGVALPPIYGMFGILLVFSLKFYPFVFLLTASGLGAISPAVEEAAESLGAGPWRRFFKVTLPLVLPSVSSGALLAFVLSIADFGTPSIVGGNVRLLATTAYDLFTAEMGGNPGLASATSIVLIAVCMAVVVLQRWAVRRRDVAGSLIRSPVPRRLPPAASAAAHAVCYAVVLAGSLPSLVVIYTSFRNTSGPVFHPGFGFDSYERILGEVPQVIANSFTYATAAVTLIVILGTAIGYLLARRESLASGTLDNMLLIPYVVPGVVMGLAFVVTFNVPPLPITGTAVIIILMLFIRRLPYAVRSSTSILHQIKGGIEEAAVSLGASPARAFRKVTLPLMLPGIVAGALMSFITAINELSSSLILYVGRTMTMPVRIYLSVLDGQFGTASALSTILLSVSGLAVFVVFRISDRKEGAHHQRRVLQRWAPPHGAPHESLPMSLLMKTAYARYPSLADRVVLVIQATPVGALPPPVLAPAAPGADAWRTAGATWLGVQDDLAGDGVGQAEPAAQILQCVAKRVEHRNHLRPCGGEALERVPLADDAIGPVSGLDHRKAPQAREVRARPAVRL